MAMMMTIRTTRPTDESQNQARIGDSPRPKSHPSGSIIFPFSSPLAAHHGSTNANKNDKTFSNLLYTIRSGPRIPSSSFSHPTQNQNPRIPIVQSFSRNRSQPQSHLSVDESQTLSRKTSTRLPSSQSQIHPNSQSPPRTSQSSDRSGRGSSLPRSASRPITPQVISNPSGLAPPRISPGSPQLPAVGSPAQPRTSTSFVTSLGLAPISTNLQQHQPGFPFWNQQLGNPSLRQFPNLPRNSSDSTTSALSSTSAFSNRHLLSKNISSQQNFPPPRSLPSLVNPARLSPLPQSATNTSFSSLRSNRLATFSTASERPFPLKDRHQQLLSHHRSHSSPISLSSPDASLAQSPSHLKSSLNQSLSLFPDPPRRPALSLTTRDFIPTTRPEKQLYHVINYEPSKGFCGKYVQPRPRFESKPALRPISVIGKRNSSTLEDQELQERILQSTGSSARRRRRRERERAIHQRSSLEVLGRRCRAIEDEQSEGAKILKEIYRFNLERAVWRSEGENDFSNICAPLTLGFGSPADRNNLILRPRVTSLSNSALRNRQSRRRPSRRAPRLSDASPSPTKLRKVGDEFPRWLGCFPSNPEKNDRRAVLGEGLEGLIPILARPFRSRSSNHSKEKGSKALGRNRANSMPKPARHGRSSPGKNVEPRIPTLKIAQEFPGKRSRLFSRAPSPPKPAGPTPDDELRDRKKFLRRSSSVPTFRANAPMNSDQDQSVRLSFSASSPISDETHTFFELGPEAGNYYVPSNPNKGLRKTSLSRRRIKPIIYGELQGEGQNFQVGDCRGLDERRILSYHSRNLSVEDEALLGARDLNRPVDYQDLPVIPADNRSSRDKTSEKGSAYSSGLEDSLCDPKIKQLIAAIDTHWNVADQGQIEGAGSGALSRASIRTASMSKLAESRRSEYGVLNPRESEILDNNFVISPQLSRSEDEAQRASRSRSPSKGLLRSLPRFLDNNASNISPLPPPPRKRNLTSRSAESFGDCGTQKSDPTTSTIPSSPSLAVSAPVPLMIITDMNQVSSPRGTKVALPHTPKAMSTPTTTLRRPYAVIPPPLESSSSVQRRSIALSLDDRSHSRLSDPTPGSANRWSDGARESSSECYDVGNFDYQNSQRGSFGWVSLSQDEMNEQVGKLANEARSQSGFLNRRLTWSPIERSATEEGCAVERIASAKSRAADKTYLSSPTDGTDPNPESSEVMRRDRSEDLATGSSGLQAVAVGSKSSLSQPQRQLSSLSNRSNSSSHSIIDLDKYIDQADLFYQAPRSPRRDLIQDYDQILDYQKQQHIQKSQAPERRSGSSSSVRSSDRVRKRDNGNRRSKLIDEILSGYAETRKYQSGTTAESSKLSVGVGQVGGDESSKVDDEDGEEEVGTQEAKKDRGKHLSEEIVDKFEQMKSSSSLSLSSSSSSKKSSKSKKRIS